LLNAHEEEASEAFTYRRTDAGGQESTRCGRIACGGELRPPRPPLPVSHDDPCHVIPECGFATVIRFGKEVVQLHVIRCGHVSVIAGMIWLMSTPEMVERQETLSRFTNEREY